jgi:hypothetical protein
MRKEFSKAGVYRIFNKGNGIRRTCGGYKWVDK